jgi:hypothetical protein
MGRVPLILRLEAPFASSQKYSGRNLQKWGGWQKRLGGKSTSGPEVGAAVCIIAEMRAMLIAEIYG